MVVGLVATIFVLGVLVAFLALRTKTAETAPEPVVAESGASSVTTPVNAQVPVATTTPAPKKPDVEKESAVKRADRGVSEARAFAVAKKRKEAREKLEQLLADSEISQDEYARSLVRRELDAMKKDEDAERAAKEEHEAERTPDAPKPAPPEEEGTKPEAATVDPNAKLKDAAAKARALDLSGALALLEGTDARAAEPLRAAIEARRAYLDALGAASAGATVIAPSGKKSKIKTASSAGVELEGSAETIRWSSLPRGSVTELVLSLDKSLTAQPLGAVLVLQDLGLWVRADQRAKAWLDADAGAQAQVFASLASGRGQPVPDDGFVWRDGEWLTKEEDRARAGDLVRVDGRLVARDEARKLVEKQRKGRAPTKKAQQDAARARADELRRDYGVTEIKTLLSTGDPAKRVDIVVVSDGYAEADIPRFEQISESVATVLPTIEPFRSYAHYLNVHRVTVVEAKSGIGNTRIGSRVSGDTLTCDSKAAAKYGRLAPDADLVMVCANVGDVRSTGHKGWGRYPGVITLEKTGTINHTVVHELGHAFGDLDDEYEDEKTAPDFPDFGESEEPEHLNTTRQAKPELAKWHYWLRPPLLPDESKVGCFQGAYYRRTGYYRPCLDCRMRSSSCPRYCPVCLEVMNKSFYERLEPIDDATPRTPDLVLWRDDQTKLSITALAIQSSGDDANSFKARWFLDGRPIPAKSSGIKTELALPVPGLTPGEHQIAVRVELRDARVRRDDGLLASSRAWRVTVLDAARPRVAAPDHVSVKRGELVAFDVSVDQSGSPLRASGPSGMSFTAFEREGRFTWVPPRNARGAFRAGFSVGAGAARVERVTEISVLDEAHEVAPLLADPGTVTTVRGQALTVNLSAQDPDGDALLYSSRSLPPGAELDPATGVFRWTPSYATPYQQEVEVPVRVTDGKMQDELTFRIRVDNKAIAEPGPGFDHLCATRSPSPEVRLKAIKALPEADLPEDAKILELARLLRDNDAEVRAAALELLPRLPGFDARRSLLALDLQDHVWDTDDLPLVRGLVQDIATGTLEGDGKAAGARIQKDLAAVEKYNKDRGAR